MHTKLKVLGLLTGAALLGLTATTASATDVYVGVELGSPVVVERRPVHYYEEYEPVTYIEYREYPRTTYVYREREVRYYERHDHGRHRGHHKHRHYR